MLIPNSYFEFKMWHVLCGVAWFTLFLLTALDLQWQGEKARSRYLHWNLFLGLPLLLVQLLLGFSIISVHPYSVHLPWVMDTFIAYLGVFFLWLLALFSVQQKNYLSWRISTGLVVLFLLFLFFFMTSQL